MDFLPPPISLIMPVYNAEKYIGAALESAFRQGFANLEIIVVDDGSTDNTAVIIQDFNPNIRYIYQDNHGASAARNHGLRLAQGELITFLDADDQWAPNKVALQLSYLKHYPWANIVVGYSRLMNNDTPAWLFLNLGSAIFRQQVFADIGNFDSNMPYSDDLDWFMRAREAGVKFVVHREVVLYHRRHETNLTNNHAKRDHFNLVMLKHSLERRRQSQAAALSNFSDFEVDKLPPEALQF